MAVSAAAVSDLETVSIVLVGQFQIDEFEPANLYDLGCIEIEELVVGKIPLRLPDAFVIHFPTLRIHVESDKLVLSSTVEEPIFERVQEFFLMFFSSSKKHAASAMGINCDLHRRIENLERWHAIGHRLVPKDTWRDALGLRDPGLVTVSVRALRDDGENGVVNVRSEPSSLLRPGIYVQINDHFNLGTEGGIDAALRIVNTQWKSCRRRHVDIPAAIAALR